MGKLFGGGQPSAKKQIAAQNAAAGPAGGKLFTPEQIGKVTGDYQKQALAKWNQILTNMGAAGGTGGPDLATAIASQAKNLGSSLGGLTGASGFGTDGMANLDQILRSVEPGINPAYALY